MQYNGKLKFSPCFLVNDSNERKELYTRKQKDLSNSYGIEMEEIIADSSGIIIKFFNFSFLLRIFLWPKFIF